MQLTVLVFFTINKMGVVKLNLKFLKTKSRESARTHYSRLSEGYKSWFIPTLLHHQYFSLLLRYTNLKQMETMY